MSGAKRSERWSAEKFALVSGAQRESGLSVQAFCRREGINLSSFYRWRDRVVPGRAVRRVRQNVEGFIPLTTLPRNSSLTLRFDLGEGITLTVSR